MHERYPFDVYTPEEPFSWELRYWHLFEAAGLFIRWLAYAVAILAMFWLLTPQAHAADLAVGDSIALGTGQALHVTTKAIEAASSCYVDSFAPKGGFDRVVISAGINDAPGSCIETLRAKYEGAKVVWILPAAINSARAHVAAVAAKHGDATVSYRCSGRGCDAFNFHPASYPVVAEAVRRAWDAESAASPRTTGSVPVLPVPNRNFMSGFIEFFSPKPADDLPRAISTILDEQAKKEGVPVRLVHAVAKVESRGNCKIRASDGLSTGLMQVRPETAKAMGVTGDQNDCRNSAIAGVRFLKVALQQAHGNWEQAAVYYNAGLSAPMKRTHYSQLVMAAL